MKKVTILLMLMSSLLFSCSKGGDTPSPSPSPSPTPTPTEAAITFSVNVDPGAGNILGVVGTSQAIVVKISSTLPSAGVNVGVTVKSDIDSSTVFDSPNNSSVAADNTINITGLKPGIPCTATVVVTSKSTATNTKTITFRLAAK